MFASLPMLCAALLLGATVPATARAGNAQAYYAYVRRALRADLQAIPAGTPATDAQKLALANGLGELYFYVFPVPTVTLDFLADQLADAVATGTFAPEDAAAVAKELVSLLDSGQYVRPGRLAALQATLAKAQVDPAKVTQIVAALTVLPDSFGYNTVDLSLGADLLIANPEAAGYQRAYGNVSLDHYVGPTFDQQGVVTDPAFLRRSLSVQVNQLPLGRYQVNVTTADGTTAAAGTFGIHRYPPAIDADGNPVQGSGSRYGGVTFSDFGNGKPLPDGVSLDDVTGVTITDAAGVVQFTGSLAASDGALTTRSAQLHLEATAAAPTVGGTLTFTNVQGYNPDRNFLFSAEGLPASATLTLSVDGATVGPVTTGPTGNLYVKTYGAYLTPSPATTETVHLLPDTVDLSTARTFTLSDAQGNVLASANVPTITASAP